MGGNAQRYDRPRFERLCSDLEPWRRRAQPEPTRTIGASSLVITSTLPASEERDKLDGLWSHDRHVRKLMSCALIQASTNDALEAKSLARRNERKKNRATNRDTRSNSIHCRRFPSDPASSRHPVRVLPLFPFFLFFFCRFRTLQ